MTEAALTIHETAAGPVEVVSGRSTQPVTPLEMLNAAVARGASLELVNGLMSLYERWDAGQARKAFDAAVAAAKGDIPPIFKNKVVDFTSQKGRTNYRHEDFAEVARTVDPILNKHGLSYRHRAAQDGSKLRVTCVLSHRDGYSEETTLEAAEDHSGNKNSIQAIGSAATYLQRYTLKLALGLATSTDDDGRQSNPAPQVQTITEEQAMLLRELIEATNADHRGVLAYVRANDIESIAADKFDGLVAMLKRKEQRRG